MYCSHECVLDHWKIHKLTCNASSRGPGNKDKLKEKIRGKHRAQEEKRLRREAREAELRVLREAEENRRRVLREAEGNRRRAEREAEENRRRVEREAEKKTADRAALGSKLRQIIRNKRK